MLKEIQDPEVSDWKYTVLNHFVVSIGQIQNKMTKKIEEQLFADDPQICEDIIQKQEDYMIQQVKDSTSE